MKNYLNQDVAAGVVMMELFACTATDVADFERVRECQLSPLIVGILLGMRCSCQNRLRSHVHRRRESQKKQDCPLDASPAPLCRAYLRSLPLVPPLTAVLS